MPPMYINLGAWVGEGTLIDSHALVGSCAQIGRHVHVSAAAQIGGVIEPGGARPVVMGGGGGRGRVMSVAAAQMGGVIEPVGALPVVIEDDVLVGGNTGIYEGAVVKHRAVLAAGGSRTGSSAVCDAAPRGCA